MSAAAALALLAALTTAVPAHPDSRSSSLVRVEGRRVAVDLRVQVQSLLEALPLDADGDGALSDAELEAGRTIAAEYLGERYRISAGGEALPHRDTALERLSGPDDPGGPDGPGGWVRATFRCEAAADFAELVIEVSLFTEGNPFHRDECTLAWGDRAPARFRFGEEGARWRVDPDALPGPRPFGGWVGEGARHILGGLDHLAFLAALLLGARSARSLVVVVTAFTAAHSLTLALAALDVVRLPSLFVELAIALSIVYVALLAAFARVPRSRWPEAFVFGLVHGLGFAGFLGELLVFEPSVAMPLAGFNIGVELAQLGVVAPAALVLHALGRERGSGAETAPGTNWLVPRGPRRTGAVLLALAGLGWFAQRAGFV